MAKPKTEKKYDRFVMDVREIGDPATSPSQAEIDASVEINLRKQALYIFAKAAKAKSNGRKLTAGEKQTYDHFAQQYPHLVPERRAELQKQLARFIQPAEGIRANGVGPSPAEVDAAARKALEKYKRQKRSGEKRSRKPETDRRPTAAEQRLLERLTDWTADTVVMAKEFPVPEDVRRRVRTPDTRRMD